MRKKSILAILLMAILVLGLTGCTNENLEAEREYTDMIKQQVADSVGMPNLTNYFEFAQLKEIYELRDNPNLICYWYTKNDYTGKWIYQGKCVGYGIPYGASITANEYPGVGQHVSGGWVEGQIKQAEPNGLYTDSVVTTATWILTVDESGNITPSYVESEITVTQTKMESRLCEDWSLPSDYDNMSNSAEIKGEVNTDDLNLLDDDNSTDNTETVKED